MKNWILKTFFKKELQALIKEIQDKETKIINLKQIIDYKNEELTKAKRRLKK